MIGGFAGKPKNELGAARSRSAYVLRRAVEFEAVLREGTRLVTTHFVLRARANAEPHARLGIIAGRKSARRAVDRNRAKRLVREAFREAEPTMGRADVTVQLRSHLRGEHNSAIRLELQAGFAALSKRITTLNRSKLDP